MKPLFRFSGLNDASNPHISKIFSIAFVILMILSGFLMCTPGYYWLWFAMAAICTIPPLVLGPRRYRLFGTTALVLSFILIAGDIVNGQNYREMMRKRREHFAVHQ